MKATTLKIENPLLNELYGLKPKSQSFSNFVRSLLEKSVRRQKMIRAGERYIEFLTANPDEECWIGEWESADLAAPVKTRKAKKKRVS